MMQVQNQLPPQLAFKGCFLRECLCLQVSLRNDGFNTKNDGFLTKNGCVNRSTMKVVPYIALVWMLYIFTAVASTRRDPHRNVISRDGSDGDCLHFQDALSGDQCKNAKIPIFTSTLGPFWQFRHTFRYQLWWENTNHSSISRKISDRFHMFSGIGFLVLSAIVMQVNA